MAIAEAHMLYPWPLTLMEELGLAICISDFSVAGIRHCDQGNLQKNLLMVSEGLST